MNMIFAISPKHTSDQLDHPLTLNEKIEIFIARVQGWQIQPALDMQNHSIAHRGFAQLFIVISFFEMVGKYRAGFIGEGWSAKYFKEGLRWTFPEIKEQDVQVLDAFYSSVRNGLYHLGITKPNVVLIDSVPGSFGFNEELQLLAISPDRFVEDINIRFQAYAIELQNPANAEIRAAFEKRFDDNDSWEPINKKAA
jgi:hypothetical protein